MPDCKRRGIEKILSRYGLENFDAYELLKRSGAKLPIDNIEFIDPMPTTFDEELVRFFYIAGVRHYIGCNKGANCDLSIVVNKDDELYLELEPDNKKDKDAIKILDKAQNHLGYVPRYYNKEVLKFISDNRKINLSVELVNKNNNCNECIKAKIKII